MKDLRGLLSAAFIVLCSMSHGVSAQSIVAVEYKFDNPPTNGTTPNTGIGDPSPSSSLDGILFPESGHGIDASFSPSNGGLDGSPVAKFTGSGCIQVPNSHDVNMNALYSRVISLNFRWSGNIGTAGDAQVLYEEGSIIGRLNIYLDQLDSTLGRARLFMAAWSNRGGLRTSVIHTNQPIINRRTWYAATMVLDAELGTLSGYIDDVKFDEESVGFFPLRNNGQDNCLGGLKEGTLIFKPDDDDVYDEYDADDNGLYFRGQIENFRIRNIDPPPVTLPVVEYIFANETNRYENTGDGGDSPSSSLNGIPFPISHGIAFQGIGARFSRSGCIQVPNDDNINTPLEGVTDRTISLDFKWGGSDSNLEPEILWEEGGQSQGINMYLDPLEQRAANLVMAVWETNDGVLVAESVHQRIHADVWYSASLVLEQFGMSPYGTLTGYVDSVKFGQADIDFFGINGHPHDNCVGGMKTATRIFATDGSGESEQEISNGLYFNGHIGSFRLFNSVIGPVVPTASPAPSVSSAPSASPSVSSAPSASPSASPSTSAVPTASPILVVEYTFNDATDRTRSTGDGNPDPSSSLDGIPIPYIGHNIDFLEESDGNAAAVFRGSGCIKVPDSYDIGGDTEGGAIGIRGRTISIDFKWDGTKTLDQPQILFEEGGGDIAGINMYLRFNPLLPANLIMAVWTRRGRTMHSAVIRTGNTIQANRWYHATLLIDRIEDTSDGYLQGFLNGVLLEEKPIDFFDIRRHASYCLGGMDSGTRIFPSSPGEPEVPIWNDGLFFHGQIDNFALFNSAETPTLPPTSMPTTTSGPSPVPSTSPSSTPSLAPSTSHHPSLAPSTSHHPSLAPSTSPSLTPSTTAPTLVVEYTFDNVTDRTRTTGDGNPYPSSSLDGVRLPRTGNGGIYFLEESDGSAAAVFTGAGCIEVPKSRDINGPPKIGDRTISLDFWWNGTDSTDPQLLFDEGGARGGINMYLSPARGRAELVMSVWETELEVLRSAVVHMSIIQPKRWYNVALIIDQVRDTSRGYLQGYLNGMASGKERINFFEINQHSAENCLGGMIDYTRIFSSKNLGDSEVPTDYAGFFFNGKIDNFRLFNSVEIPTPSPTSMPTTTSGPSTSAQPSFTPSNQPSLSPIPSDIPSENPSFRPSLKPSDSQSASPTDEPSSSPSDAASDMPSTHPSSAQPSSMPSNQPSLSPIPSDIPSENPSFHPSLKPSDSQSASPTDEPSSSPSNAASDMPSAHPSSAQPSSMPSNQPSLSPIPSDLPSDNPSTRPSLVPSDSPSTSPADEPSSIRSGVSSDMPSAHPTAASSVMPSVGPAVSNPSLAPSFWSSMEPSRRPSNSPSNAPSSWVTITYDNFENGLGNFSVSGATELWVKRTRAHQGEASVRIKGSSGSNSSLFYSSDHAFFPFANIRYSFWYYALNMNDGEGFVFEYSPNSGVVWIPLKTFVKGQDFENEAFYNGITHMETDETRYSTTRTARIRFRFLTSETAVRFRAVFIDEVLVEGQVCRDKNCFEY